MNGESPVERSLHAQAASLTYWSQVTDRRAATRPGREGLTRKWEREIDPDGTLPPEELARRVELRRKAHMANMSRLAAKKAREKREAKAASTSTQSAGEVSAL
jgi:hypothetical protein